MKKILTLALLLFLVGCQPKDINEEPVTEDPVMDQDEMEDTSNPDDMDDEKPMDEDTSNPDDKDDDKPMDEDTTEPVEMMEFDLETLSMYNGVDMDKMYIAVKGIVYDVTDDDAWSTGEHNGYMVGKDITDGFMLSPHSEALLTDMVKIGTLVVDEFSLEELSMYNGVDMDTMYIAVDGIVYDVTGVAGWASGEHQGYMVGNDVTEGFIMSPHAMATLDDLTIVGVLIVEEFSLEELSMHNGVDMDTMYIAVDGIVYDVTGVAGWASGEHQGYMVGNDVTEGFIMSPHAMATLDDLTIVGILKE